MALFRNAAAKNFLQLLALFAAGALLFYFFAPTQKQQTQIRPAADLGKLRNSSQYLTRNLPDAHKAFTLYPTEHEATIALLNHQGEVVHHWKADAERARLLPNCNLLVVHGSKWGRYKEPWKGLRDTIREYDWNGELVWEHKEPDVIHHDVHRLANGNTLFIRRTMVPPSVKDELEDLSLRQRKIRGDSVIEVLPSGEHVYSWHAHEHLDLNSCGRRSCRDLLEHAGSTQRALDWTHGNTASPLPENKWFRAGDERFRPGNFLFLPRNWWQVILLSRNTGEVLWEYGGEYRGGIGGGHESHMIPDGFPGAGNILIFDNGSSTREGQSIILEINPTTKKPVWVYDAPGFWSQTRGSVQRLPNGNTFISEDITGRAFEVTPDKRIVWEFKGPYPTNRAKKYSADFCPKLKSLTLTQ